MPLQVSPLLESDIPAFCDLEVAAAANWLYARAMEPPGVPRRVFIEKWLRDSWGKDPLDTWMKVSDTDTGELVSCALWRIPCQRAEPSESEGEQQEERKWEDLDFWAYQARRWSEFEKQFIGDQQYALLSILVTDPKHQRRGAGGMLVDWGCRIADEKGWICALGASEAGFKMYSSHGFELKEEELLDLAQFGVQGTEWRRRMIRPAKQVDST
jgi:GNAT superfamily N-acetyltransferase